MRSARPARIAGADELGCGKIRPMLSFERLQVRFDHFADKLVKRNSMSPAELRPCLGGGPDQNGHFRRREVTRIDVDEQASRRRIETFLVNACPAPFDARPDVRKRLVHKLPYRM